MTDDTDDDDYIPFEGSGPARRVKSPEEAEQHLKRVRRQLEKMGLGEYVGGHWIGSNHRPFYDHLKAGGRVFRSDSMNGVEEVMTAESIGGAERIALYGFRDLTILEDDLPARPMTSLWASLTPEQQERVRTYDAPIDSGCTCASCQPIYPYFRVCSTCGNKRCPRAANHELACTDSNEPGQPGSLHE